MEIGDIKVGMKLMHQSSLVYTVESIGGKYKLLEDNIKCVYSYIGRFTLTKRYVIDSLEGVINACELGHIKPIKDEHCSLPEHEIWQQYYGY